MSEKTLKRRHNVAMAKALAPEDIKRGQYVMPLHTVREFVYLAESVTGGAKVHKSKVEMLPWETGIARVSEVCLPFVLLRSVRGKYSLLDTRSEKLARVPALFGRVAFERLKPKRKRRGKCDSSGGGDD